MQTNHHTLAWVPICKHDRAIHAHTYAHRKHVLAASAPSPSSLRLFYQLKVVLELHLHQPAKRELISSSSSSSRRTSRLWRPETAPNRPTLHHLHPQQQLRLHLHPPTPRLHPQAVRVFSPRALRVTAQRSSSSSSSCNASSSSSSTTSSSSSA